MYPALFIGLQFEGPYRYFVAWNIWRGFVGHFISLVHFLDYFSLGTGNEKGNQIWEKKSPAKIHSSSSDQERKIFIELKYKRREFCHLYPMNDQSYLDKALAKSVQDQDLTTTMRLIATGADVTAKWGDESLLELANR